MGRYVHTQTSVTIVMSIICAGTYAPGIPTPAPAIAPLRIKTVMSSAAHHMKTTAALMMWISTVLLLILAAQAALLPTRMIIALALTRGEPQDVTTPSNTADILETMPNIPALMVAVSR